MNELEESRIDCPYCGESIDVLLDPSAGDQEYVEDCQVCCRPINFSVSIHLAKDISVVVRSDDE